MRAPKETQPECQNGDIQTLGDSSCSLAGATINDCRRNKRRLLWRLFALSHGTYVVRWGRSSSRFLCTFVLPDSDKCVIRCRIVFAGRQGIWSVIAQNQYTSHAFLFVQPGTLLGAGTPLLPVRTDQRIHAPIPVASERCLSLDRQGERYRIKIQSRRRVDRVKRDEWRDLIRYIWRYKSTRSHIKPFYVHFSRFLDKQSQSLGECRVPKRHSVTMKPNGRCGSNCFKDNWLSDDSCDGQ